MNFKKWFKEKRKDLEYLNKEFENDTGTKMPLERFAKGMFKETTHYQGQVC